MRILLAEDEPNVRSYLVRALAHVAPSYAVEAVPDGARALDAFATAPADLVISDHHMPHLTGLELLRALRAVSRVPFLLISADRAVEPYALRAGCSQFLVKPLSLEDLRDAISRCAPAADALY